MPALRPLALILLFGTGLWAVGGQDAASPDPLVDRIEFRNLGPFRAGAWITDIAVPERPGRAHRTTIYVATRNGGLWKTTNAGTTFEPLLDAQGVSSIGAIALAPSDPDRVWAGTGEAYNARSSYSGSGLYRSVDGGRTWQHAGLADSHHVARIVVHPSRPDVVYVAAMGHLFTPNAERGVFRTVDGGRSWERVLHVGDQVGAIDLVMSRRDPSTLYAAMYRVRRLPWDLEDGGADSGIYKTTDGGRTWRRLEGGLPTGTIGRIGLALFPTDPRVVYALVENRNTRQPTADEAQADRQRGIEPRPRLVGGELYRSDDAGRTWRKTHDAAVNLAEKAGYSFTQVRVDPVDAKRVWVLGETLASSDDGGGTWMDVRWPATTRFKNIFGDVRTLWIDAEDPEHMLVGSDGGVHVSFDRGATADHLANLPLGEVYAVGVDMAEPYNVYAGLQDHESWKGPSQGWSGRITVADWVTVGTGDGMYNQVDPVNGRWVYNTAPFGLIYRVDQQRHERVRITPERPRDQPPYRFNWVAPIVISPHHHDTIYLGTQVLLKSLDRGSTWTEISPDLTTNDASKHVGGGGAIRHCTITTISESPGTPGVIWVGTDDGRVQVTRNAGVAWSDTTQALARAGGPAHLWVSRVLASSAAPGTAYVTKSGFRNDDFVPYVFRTADYGATWTRVVAGLPDRPVNVIIESARNPDVLFLGNDQGVYVSVDGAGSWRHMKANLPPVPVHDLVIHPRERDLIVATYGRALWIGDISPIEELTREAAGEALHVFDIRPRRLPGEGAWGNYHLYGDRHLWTPNAPGVMTFAYHVRETLPAPVTLTITTPRGVLVRSLTGPAESGLQRVVWDGRDEKKAAVPPGEYDVTVEGGGVKVQRVATLKR